MVRPIRLVMVVVPLVALLAGGVAMHAQDRGAGRGRGAGAFGPGGPPAAMMLRELNLTDAQRQQVRQIMEQYRPQFEDLNNRLQNDIRGVLTPEQQQQADKLRAERQTRTKERRQNRTPNAQ
jgi:Spy/CpxP family protein refolding chaperone